ncbi:MAG: adenylate/guanylate cyclase domain-containing protein [Actinomycetota bacterium]
MRACPNCQEDNLPSAKFCQSCGAKLEAQETVEVRKLATVVFCDVTGSTALGEKLDPEVLRRLITRYFEDMRVVLTRHGGTVEKFIGDAVMAVFGVPVVHEDDALRALRAALEMQELVKQIVTPGTDETGALQVRIGVNTGEVIAGDSSAGHGFVSGDTVNVAARFEQAAEPGQILIGESTYRLASDFIEADPVPPLDLKGKSQPMRAYALRAVKSQRTALTRTAAELVGRSEELTQLTNTFSEVVATGTPRWVSVVGDAGAGKTALIDAFRSAIESTGRVLVGRCLSYGEGITFWPIAEAVKEAAGIVELDGSRGEAAERLAQFVGEAPDRELLVPRLSAALGLSDDVVGAQEVMWAVRGLLQHMALQSPIVLLIDDIHWAEPTLLDLVEYLATFMQDVPVLLLTVGRGDLLEKRPEWLARTAVIHIQPLGQDDVKKLMRKILKDDMIPAQVESRVLEAGQGNPLYVQEILKMMLEQRLLEQVDGRWRATAELEDFEVPRTIQALLAARLERLPHEERAVVQRGSVIGKVFWFGAVSALTTEELRHDIGRYLQSLVRKDLLEPQSSELAGEDSFRFEQTLMRDAAYGALPKQHRAELHEKVAAWLIERAGDRVREYEDVLGHHWEQAVLLRRSLGDEDEHTELLARQAGEVLGRSGRRAFASGDLPAAVGFLKRSVALLPRGATETLELQLDLSSALAESGELRAARAVTDEVLATATESQLSVLAARARLQASSIRSMTDFSEWMETAGEELPELLAQLTELGDELGQVRALQLLADYHWDNLRTAKAQELLSQALPMARKIGDRVEEGKIEGFLAAAAFWGPMPVNEAIQLCTSISSARLDDRLLQAKCMRSLSALHAMRGEFDQAREMAALSRTLHMELGQLLSLAHSSQYFGLVEMMAGDYDSAIALLKEGLDALIEMGDEAFSSTQSALLSRALHSAGRLDEAYEMTLKSEQTADPAEARLSEAEWGPTRMRVLVARGQMQEAAKLGERVVEAAQVVEDVICAGNCLTAVAELFELAKQADQARTFYSDALAIYEAKGALPLAVEVRAKLEAL